MTPLSLSTAEGSSLKCWDGIHSDPNTHRRELEAIGWQNISPTCLASTNDCPFPILYSFRNLHILTLLSDTPAYCTMLCKYIGSHDFMPSCSDNQRSCKEKGSGILIPSTNRRLWYCFYPNVFMILCGRQNWQIHSIYRICYMYKLL